MDLKDYIRSVSNYENFFLTLLIQPINDQETQLDFLLYNLY